MVIAALVAAGCSSFPSPLAVAPDSHVAVGQFTGEWIGSYRGQTVKRDGPLSIVIESADSTAGAADRVPIHGRVRFGGVPRDPKDAAFPLTAAERRSALEQTVPIDSARLTADGIVMWLQPYFDSGCSCTVSLTTRGVLRGDTLAGTFSAEQGATRVSPRGRWRAVRQRSP